MPSENLRGRRLGGFELDELLGEGAFGSVWRARQLRLERDVAVKVLDPHVARDPAAARRFEREGRSAAALDHPSIVPVYEAGDDDGLYYLAMRLVDGETLEERMERTGAMSVAQVADLLEPVADALDHAHAAGFVHRDVKPSNILIDDRQVFLSDFGIAALTTELGRYTTGSIGTAEYMAPEQARGEEIDGRADLYALGCVALHAITGSSPFARTDMVATMVAHTTDSPPSTGDARVDQVIGTALAKDPAERYATARDFVGALRGGPTSAASDTTALAAAGPTGAGGTRSRRALLLGATIGLIVAAIVVAALLADGGDDGSGDGDTSAGATGGTATTIVAEASATTVADDGTGAAGDTGTDDEPATPTTADTDADADADADDDGDAGDSDDDGGAAEDLPVAIRSGGNVDVGTTLRFDSPNPHADLDAATVLSEWVLPVLFAVDGDLDASPSLATGEPQPDPDDPSTIIWTLHDDVVWNDGTPVTARDVEATWRYLSDPVTSATNLLLYDDVTAVVARDDRTLAVTFAEPNGGYRLLFSTIHPIVQAEAYDAHLAAGGTAADFLADGVSFAAGPYQVARNTNDGEISLIPNPEWPGARDGGPHLDRIRFVTYSDTTSLVDALGRGEVDVIWAERPGPGDVRELADLAEIELQITGSDLSKQLTFNTARAPFDDPTVRQAVLATIDVPAVAQSAVSGITQRPADPLESLVYLPGQAPYRPTFTGIRDLAAANAALDSAGWVVGDDGVRVRDGERLQIELITSQTPEDLAIFFVAASDLQSIGVQLIHTPLSIDDLAATRDSADWDVYLQSRLFNSDPVATRLVVGSGACPAQVVGCDGVGVNFGAFSDPEVDQLLDDADRETDADARAAIYLRIDERLREQAAALPLFVEPAIAAFDASLTGIEAAPNRGPLSSLADWALRAD